MLCLGIESSCDETAVALVEDGKPCGELISSQADIHAFFGGVVPELASRAHYRNVGILFDALMAQEARKPSEIDAVAVTRGPGLLGSLLVGTSFAKMLALGLNRPLIGVNHLHAHLMAVAIRHEISFPCLGVLASGGHTNLYLLESFFGLVQLGKTIDDAAGECFDKVGKVLHLTYPAGAAVDDLASGGRPEAITFPRPYIDNDTLDFSFSGLKTAVALHLHKNFYNNHLYPDHSTLQDICASFNMAVADSLASKVERAIKRYPQIRQLILAGGCACNRMLRQTLAEQAQKNDLDFLVPDRCQCTDNALMVAFLGYHMARQGLRHDLSMETIPRGKTVPDDSVSWDFWAAS